MDQALIDTISPQLEQRIASKSLALPMLPQVINQVLSLVNDEDTDAAALAKLVQSDPALAGHVMRIANSAAYSPNVQMTSLQQAIARLGMQSIADIALAATMGPKLFKAEGFETTIKDIWQTSLATAIWSREIARQGRSNVESAFLSGLLCQIGRPVVLQAVVDIAKGDAANLDVESMNHLMAHFQTQVGTVLAQHWQLPMAVVHCISSVDSDDAAEGSQNIVDTVKAAQVFAAITLADRNYDEEQLAANNHVINVNFYAEDVQKVLEKTEAIHATLSELSL